MSYNINKHPGEYAGRHTLAADAVIETGGLYGPDAGGDLDAPGTALFVIGRATADVDNTGGADGALTVDMERGVFACANAAVNPVTKVHLGAAVFATAPDSIASAGTTHAGTLIGFDIDGSPLVDTTTAATNAAIAAGDAP